MGYLHDKFTSMFGHSETSKNRITDPGIVIPKTKLASVASSIADILHSFRLARGLTLKDAIDTDGLQSDSSFTTKDYGLVAAIEVLGTYSLISEQEYLDASERIDRDWRGMLASSGVMLDWCFVGGDREMVEKQATDMLEPSLQTLKRLGLKLGSVISEDISVLGEHCRYEKNYLCVWVDPRIAETVTDRRIISKDRVKKLEDIKLRGMESMEVIPVAELVEDRLEAYVGQILSTFRALNIKARRETCSEMLTVLRGMMERQTAYSWKPKLPGSAPIRKKTKNNKDDYSHLLPPAIVTQLIPNAVGDLVDDARMINYGGKLHGGVIVDLACADALPFNAFFRSMREIDIPYRIRITMSGNGLQGTGLQMKTFFAYLLSWTDFSNTGNRQFLKAIDHVKEMVSSGSRQAVGLRICAETWVDLTVDDSDEIRQQKKLLASHVEKLSRAVQAWGSMETTQNVGDALERSMASLPALKRLIPATETAVNFDAITPMLPFTRMATVWDAGAMILRTPDGKLIPFQPASSKQKEWAELWIGRQRYGKSLAMGVRTLAVIASPGNTEIPYCFTTDIGYSSSGLINLVANSLPKEKRYLVKHIKLSNQPQHSINPLDTQLCARYPTSSHSDFLANLVQTLLSSETDGSINDTVKSMIPEVIKQTYRLLSDSDGKPKVYNRGQDAVVDSGIDRLNIVTEGKGARKLSWWAITDILFKKGEYHLASLAQRYAVPTIKEIAEVSMRRGILSDMYHRTNPGTGHTYAEEFASGINAAVDTFPILKQHTMFDIGQARIVALDIQDICGQPSQKEGQRKTAIAYMLSRHIFMSRIGFSREDLVAKIGTTNTNLIPSFAYEYHLERIKDLEKTVKTMNYDEVHRATNIPSIVSQWMQDVREGPKFKIITSFATQGIQDIPDELYNLTSLKVLMGLGDADADLIADKLQLNDTLRDHLKNAKRPDSKGSTGVYIMDTEEGNTDYIGIFMLTKGPRTIWALSTTRDDDVLRRCLYEQVDVNNTLDLLVKHFPETTWAPYLEKLAEANRSQRKIAFEREVAAEMVAGSFDRTEYLNKIRRFR